MNEDVRDFLNRNKIDADKMVTRYGIIRKPEEINYIVARYALRKPRKNDNISIADILGYDNSWRNTDPFIIKSMDSFFDRNGSGYQSRSIGLLDYTTENAMEKIDFTYEKMVVDEMEKGQYTISTNGLHRYTVLRILYLSEWMNAKGDKEEIERLKRKYTIPVQVNEVDFFKTYSKYLLMCLCDEIKDVEKEYDREKFQYTGRLIIITTDQARVIIEKDEDLLEYVKGKASVINQNINRLQWPYNAYESFREFLKSYYADSLDIERLEKVFKEEKEGEKVE